jgi:hypothetical protein
VICSSYPDGRFLTGIDYFLGGDEIETKAGRSLIGVEGHFELILIMEEIIKVYKVEADKSAYTLELIRASNGYLYISICQATFSYLEDAKISKVKIRAANFDEIIQILTDFQSEISRQKPERRIFSPEKREQILNRYLNKKIEIETLAVQFGCSFNEIAQLLIDENIQLTSNQLPGAKRVNVWRKKRSG